MGRTEDLHEHLQPVWAMTADHYERLYSVLRGPIRCADEQSKWIFDVTAQAEMEQLIPIVLDIEAQAEARARFKHLLELAWALKNASSSYAEVTHDLGCGKSKERGNLLAL